MTNDEIDFVTAAPTTVDANVRWIDGTDVDEPSYQVHRLEQHTYIIRQSLRTSPEGPFVYLLLGNSTAFLIDTGATRDPLKWPLRAVVERLIAEWLMEHPREAYGLIVAHSHGHGDHTAGDKEFLDRPDTTVVGSSLDDVIKHFGFTNWPSPTVSVDLGGRELLLIPSPGHQEASITFYDPWTAVLFTGDTIYPGRLYVRDMDAFLVTIGTLVDFADTHPVSHLLGGHVELSMDAGQDFPLGARQHPNERPLPVTVQQLEALHQRTVACAGKPGIHAGKDFIIYNGNRVRDQLKLVLRSLRSPLRK